MPQLLKQGLGNLQNPVKLYAQLAIQSARSIDPLLNKSLMALDVDLAPNEHEELVKARDAALAAAHGYADDLEKRLERAVPRELGASNHFDLCCIKRQKQNVFEIVIVVRFSHR